MTDKNAKILLSICHFAFPLVILREFFVNVILKERSD
jgi:hypothetical protein